MSTPPKRSGSNCSFSRGPDNLNVKRVQDESQNVERNRMSFTGSLCSEVSTPRHSVDNALEESCALRHFSKHKSSHLRFLAWVAYTRKYANDTITDEERRTCPLLWCREKFVDQEAMLKHVWECPELNKGLYWCFPCARSERLGKMHKRCQRLPSRTDRLATVAKKIFSKLGTGGHRKSFSNLSVSGHSSMSSSSRPTDLSTSKEWRSQGDATNLHTQIQELPDTSIIAEMAGDWTAACQELPDTSILEMVGTECTRAFGNEAENYSDNFYAESFDDYAPASIVTKTKILSPSLPRLNTTMMPSNDSMEWMNSAQRLPHISSESWSDASHSSHIVSPMSAVESFNGNFDVEISPTDSEASGNSFFSDSGYTSASTQSVLGFSTSGFSRPPSFNNSAGTKRTRNVSTFPKKYPTGNIPIVPPTVMFPVSMPQLDQAFTQSMNSSTSVSRSSSTASDKSRAGGFSPHWSDASKLVNSLSEVLEAHIAHSRTALESMPVGPVTSELLAMSMNSMISIGSDALAKIFEGRLPTTIAQVYAATHFACACAIVMGQNIDHVFSMNWLNETLHWASCLALETHRVWYIQIASSIWRPSHNTHHNGQSQRSREESSGQLLKACRQFLDLFENCENQRKEALETTATTPGFDFAQLSFEFKAKSRVIDKLITMNSIEAFITDVIGIEKRLQQGHIPNTRKLELELICKAKFSSESSVAYDRFVYHVTTLCDELYAEQSSTEPSRATHHLRDIALLKEYLLAPIHTDQVPDRGDDLENDFTDDQFLFGIDFDFKAASEEVASEVFAFSEEADNVLRHNGTSYNSQGLSPLPVHPSSSAQTPQSASMASCPKLAPQSRTTPKIAFTATSHQVLQYQAAQPTSTNTHRCHCGYVPTGEEKWKASNLRRHKRVQHASENNSKKEYRCRWAGCKSVFTRSDNLRSHQRDKGHAPGLGMSLTAGASAGGNGDQDEDEEAEQHENEGDMKATNTNQQSRTKKRRLARKEGLSEEF